MRTPEEKVGSSHLLRLRPGPSSPMAGASPSRERSPKLLPRHRPTARAHLGAVPPGEGLGKPQEKRASERRHRRDSHGQQRRRAQPLLHRPPPGGSPAAPVRSQPPALHAGKGLPPLLRDFSSLDAQASRKNCTLGLGVRILRILVVLDTDFRDPAGDSKRKASPTVVKCRLLLHPGPCSSLGWVGNGVA